MKEKYVVYVHVKGDFINVSSFTCYHGHVDKRQTRSILSFILTFNWSVCVFFFYFFIYIYIYIFASIVPLSWNKEHLNQTASNVSFSAIVAESVLTEMSLYFIRKIKCTAKNCNTTINANNFRTRDSAQLNAQTICVVSLSFDWMFRARMVEQRLR